jgi:hypothetical protein
MVPCDACACACTARQARYIRLVLRTRRNYTRIRVPHARWFLQATIHAIGEETAVTVERTPTSATGGLTEQEMATLQEYAQLWAERANRTRPIDPDKIIPAIKALYAAAEFSEPRIVVVPSPGVMAFAGAFAADIWERREDAPAYVPAGLARAEASVQGPCHALADAALAATVAATSGERRNPIPPRPEPPRFRNRGMPRAGTTSAGKPTRDPTAKTDIAERARRATYDEADRATSKATDRTTGEGIRDGIDFSPLMALYDRVRDAMRDDFGNSVPTEMMVRATNTWGLRLATGIFGNETDAALAVEKAPSWWRFSHSGNAGAYWDYCVTAARDVLGLQLPEFGSYQPWEDCAIQGGFRYMHPEFCLVCDFPAEVEKDANGIANRYRWRDGWDVQDSRP